MRKLLIGIVVLLVLLGAAAVALPFLIPTGPLVARLEQAVEQRTGRDFTVAGPVSVSVLPVLAVTAEDVRFAGFQGGDDLLRLGRLDLRLRLWPLLSGDVQVDRFVLVEPRIVLETDARGRANWDLTAPQSSAPQSGAPQSGATVQDLALGDVEVVDGTLIYRDGAAGTERVVQDLDASVTLAALDEPLAVEATLSLDGRPLRLSASAAPARAVVAGGNADIQASVEAAGTALTLGGTLARPADGGVPRLEGPVQATVDSLPDLLAWLTGGAPPELPVQSLRLAGTLQATPQRVALGGFDLAADDIAAKGDIAVALGGARPAVRGSVAVARLDLDRLLPPPPAAEPTPVPATPPAGQPPAAGATADPGWSREPVDLSALRLADADLTVQLAGVLVSGVEAGPTRLGLTLDNGRLAATLGETALFGGSVRGAARIDGRAATPGWQVDATVAGMQAEPVLTRFAGFKRLTGASDVELALKAAGASPHDIMGSLDGRASMVFRDGAIKGINIANMVRAVTGGTAEGPQQTDFAELGASFAIAGGVARTDDLRLLAPLLRVQGGGTVALQERQVDLRIVPRLVASIEGQGAGRTDQSGLSVPILVRGSFTDLSFTPDLAGIARETLRDPKAAKEALKDLKGTLKGATEGVKPEDAVRGALEGLLGGRRPEQAPQAKPPQGQ